MKENEMKKYRKKPVEVEAIQWDGKSETLDKLFDFCKPRHVFTKNGAVLIIETLEGNHNALLGDFIIKGVKGECYPCKNEIFHLTYEKVLD